MDNSLTVNFSLILKNSDTYTNTYQASQKPSSLQCKPLVQMVTKKKNTMSEIHSLGTNKFTFEMLKSSFPPGVAATKKEYYLSDEEFAYEIRFKRSNGLAVEASP